MSGELICRSCGKVNDESRDFCEKCGEYLRWELTRAMPAAIQVQGQTPPPMPVPVEDASARTGDVPEDPFALGGSDADADDLLAEAGVEAADTDGWLRPEFDLSAEETEPDEHPTLIDVPGPENSDELLSPAPLDLNVEALSAVMPELAETHPAGSPIPETGGATLVVHRAGLSALEQGEAAIAPAEPGASVTYEFMLRNVSSVVDNYDLVVAGLPPGWAAIAPQTAYLVPYGSGGASDQLVKVTISPPRSAEAEARVWPFELVALSRADGGIAARAAAGAEVGAFNAWELTPVPALRAGRFRGRYAVTVGNLGNAPIELWMYATEAENRLRGHYAHSMLPLSPGESRTTSLTVRPPRPRIIGRHIDRIVSLEALPDPPEPPEPTPPLKQRLKRYVTPGGVTVGPHGVTVRKPRVRMPRPPTKQLKLEDLRRLTAAGPSGPVSRTQVTFRHKPIISTWMLLLALLVAAAIAAYLLTRTQKVTVPALIGLRTTFAAQQKLQQRGLMLNPTEQQEPNSYDAPGTIVGQYPLPGKDVKKGTQVTLEVAVSTGRDTVPNLSGDTRAQADTALRKNNLSLGITEPVTAPLSWVVQSQIPQSGQSVAAGTAIQLYLTAPKSAAKTTKKGPAKSVSKGSGPAAPPPLTVPDVAGQAQASAEAALTKAGLVPVITSDTYYINAQTAAGDVTGTTPAGGADTSKGARVTLFVSLGEPDIAYDTGSQVALINSSTGASIGGISGPDPAALAPSFSPDGREFVYSSATRVFLDSTAAPSKPTPIYQGSDPYSNVTFAPDPNAQVLALDRQINGIGELCLAGLSGNALSASCLPDDAIPGGAGDWNLDGSIAWSPNGKEILAEAVSTADSGTFGVVEYTTNVPFSTNAANWNGGTMQTDVTEPGQGVLAAQFDPKGNFVALISNLASSQYELSLVKQSDLDPTNGALTLPVPACNVAWRPDGTDLAIIEGNSTCSGTTGTLVQVQVGTKLGPLTVLASGAADPSYQNLDAASVSH